MRKSSRGNPWHDSHGRFCSGPSEGGCRSERTEEEYAERTAERVEEQKEYDEKLKNAYVEATRSGEYEEYNKISDEYVKKYGYQAYRKSNDAAVDASLSDNKSLERLSEEDKSVTELWVVKETTKNSFTVENDGYSISYNDGDVSVTAPDGSTHQFDSVEDAKSFCNEQTVRNDVMKALKENGDMPVYQDEERTFIKHRILNEKFGDSPKEAEARAKEQFTIVDGNGDTRYLHDAVAKVDGNGRVYYEAIDSKTGYAIMVDSSQYYNRNTCYLNGEKPTVGSTIKVPMQHGYSDCEGVVTKVYTNQHGVECLDADIGHGETRTVAMEQFSQKQMPWDKDPHYANMKNGRLVWLSEHPEHKYNNQELIFNIKKIQQMSDFGASAERRRAEFKNMLQKHSLSDYEGRMLLGEEFLK